MADWVGRNNSHDPGQTYTFDSQVLNATNVAGNFPTNENFKVISPTSIGGQVQAKVNYNQDPNRNIDEIPESLGGIPNANYPHLYLADQSLEGPALDFTSTLHMDGTITWNTPSDVGIEPNFCFCWYNSGNTAKRIGLGISNTVDGGNTAQPDSLRIDFGYAALPANKFYNVSADGTQSQVGNNPRLPDGTYHFTFDYTPGPPGDFGGTMTATVTDATHNYTATISPLANDPWNLETAPLDRFGIVIRTTSGAVRNGVFDLTISNVTYTGGTAVVGVPGDYNNNGNVDAADYVLWRKGVAPLANEVDVTGGAGVTNAGDYTAWRARFGNPPGSGSGLGAGAVPEPTTALLASLAGLAMVASWRRRS
jgi:hypothetical protein